MDPPTPTFWQDLSTKFFDSTESGILDYYRGKLQCANVIDGNGDFHDILRDVRSFKKKVQ